MANSSVVWLVAAALGACRRPCVVEVRWWAFAGRRGGGTARPRRVPFDRRMILAAVVLAGSASVLVVGPMLAVALAVCLGTVVRAVMAARAGRRRQQAERSMLAAVRMLQGELRAGSGEPAALRAAATVAGPVQPTVLAAAHVAGGRAGDVAAIFDGHDPPLPTLSALARAWRVRADTGASLVSVIARVELEVADRLATRRAVAVALAGPRSSATVLAGLPLVGVVMGAGMGAHPVRFLLDRGAGSAVLLAGVVLDVVGLWWTGRLARRADV